MSDVLAKSGIFFDEVDRICILEPEVSKSTHDLKEECQIYTESKDTILHALTPIFYTLKYYYIAEIDEFQKISNKYINLVQQLGDTIEKEKMKAIGARNILQSMEKQKENNHEQLQVRKKIM